MQIAFTKKQTATLLGLSEDSVERLVYQGRLKRIPGVSSFRVTISSLSEYASLPIDQIQRLCRPTGPDMPTEQKRRSIWPSGGFPTTSTSNFPVPD